MKVLPKPCKSCPWRKDAHAQDIPHFDLQKAEGLVHTCPDSKGMGPDFEAAIFACHQSTDDNEFPCAGWMAQVGHASPRVRLAIALGALPLSALKGKKDWPQLHISYTEVITKLRADCEVDNTQQ